MSTIPDDEGELTIAMAVDPKHRIIRVHFLKPVAWLGLDLDSAKTVVANLNQCIAELEALPPANAN